MTTQIHYLNQQTNTQIHKYDTRISSQLRTPYERLDSGINSFFVKGIKIWNILPIDIKSVKNIIYFKSKIKKYLLETVLLL